MDSTVVLAVFAVILLALLVFSANARTVLADILKHPTTGSTLVRNAGKIEILSDPIVQR